MALSAEQFAAMFDPPARVEPDRRPRTAHARDNFFAMQGGFRGGQSDRLTEAFNPGDVGPNQAHRGGGRTMRQRARDLVLNNPMAASAVDAYVTNVIQCGITPKPSFDDRDARKKWVSAWNRWGGMTAHSTRESDVTGQDTLHDQQALFLTEVIVGGGCLVHFVELPRRGRTIPLSIELLPEERFADEVLISGPNRKTANPVTNGVEFEESTGRAVAYWVRQQDSDTNPLGTTFEPVRLSRDECEYAFFRRRIGQYRGHTLLHSAIVWLWALGYYTDNELIASNAKSSYAYMIQTDLSADSGFDWNELADSSPSTGTTDFYGNPLMQHEAGKIFRGAPGDKVQAVGPNVPGSDSSSWIEMIQRSIAFGCGLSYEEVCRDFSKGSFSSVRASRQSDQQRFRRVSDFTISRLNNPTWSRFASAGVRAGLDGFPTAAEYVSNQDEWLAVKWEGPSWESVNPSDDAKADNIKIGNGTKTRSACIPGDFDDHVDELKREAKALEGLSFDAGDPNADAGATDGQLEQQQSTKGRGR